MKSKETLAEKRRSFLMFLIGSLIVPLFIAILAGIFGFTQSIVDLIPWISENSGKTISWQSFFIPPETTFLIQVENDESVVVKPPLCKNPIVPELKSSRFIDIANRPIFQNILVTQTTGIISHVIFDLVEYTPPIDYTKYDKIYFFTPPGMGNVPEIIFPETTILPTSSQIEIWLDDDFIRVDPGDAVRLYLPLNFPEEGTYKFHIALFLDIAEGKTHVYKSETTKFSWVKIDSVSNFILIDSMKNIPLQWGDCP
jgi:hypothetical protein